MEEKRNFEVVRISLASPQDIRSWSHGEVKKPETINYRTFRPERDGLFCEKIFGPTRDYECFCGKYKKPKFQGIVCDKCQVEVIRSRVRRRRMGHIELAAAVAHIWHVKNAPSPIALLLDMSPRVVEKVVYFTAHIVTKADPEKLSEKFDLIVSALEEELHEGKSEIDRDILRWKRSQDEARKELESGEITDEECQARLKEMERDIKTREEGGIEHEKQVRDALDLLEDIEKQKVLTDSEYRSLQGILETAGQRLSQSFDNLFTIGMGAGAIKTLLEDIDLDRMVLELRKTITETTGAKRARSIKRLEIADAFRKSKNRPEWMVWEALPVLPPDLRPMVQLEGGRFATSDLNDLYRRVINRNNRLKKIQDIKAPDSIINHEKRLLQEAVDALIDNARKPRPVQGANQRPLKSLSDMLKGKEGRFRRNLLGKRVDYSGRSVIVVSPSLKLHECGLPREMALELFRPFIMRWLDQNDAVPAAHNIKGAKRLLDDPNEPRVQDALEEVVRNHPVLLNRAPTLHRLGIQGFMPKLVDGKAIQIHPLVCPPFNADFDGDMMAVHIPLSHAALTEARLLMGATNNVFSPSNGEPLMAPSYDIVLGCHYMTQTDEPLPDSLPNDKKPFYESGRMFIDKASVLQALEQGRVGKRDAILCKISKNKKEAAEWILTTPGRVAFNQLLPEGYGFINDVMNKSKIKDIVVNLRKRFGNETMVEFLNGVTALGVSEATRAGVTISLSDLKVETRKEEIILQTEEATKKFWEDFNEGRRSQFDRDYAITQRWLGATREVGDEIMTNIGRNNPLMLMAESGARGRREQVVQLCGMRGLMTNSLGALIHDLPVTHSFLEGLPLLEYFVCTFAGRRSLADTALRTADAGYLTRRLVDVAQEVVIKGNDCGTVNGITLTAFSREEEGISVNLWERILGRVAAERIRFGGKILIKRGSMIDLETAKAIEEAGFTEVLVRSVLTCEEKGGICSRCYGMDPSTSELSRVGDAIGVIAAQSIGEPGTQFTMRTFHTVVGPSIVDIKQYKGPREAAQRQMQAVMAQEKMDVSQMIQVIQSAPRASAEEEQKEQRMKWWLRLHVPRRRGLLRVEELFDARRPLGQSILSEYDGQVLDIIREGIPRLTMKSTVEIHEAGKLERHLNEPEPATIVEAVTPPKSKKILVKKNTELDKEIISILRNSKARTVVLKHTYVLPFAAKYDFDKNKLKPRDVLRFLKVVPGDQVSAGDPLMEGTINPHSLLALQGPEAAQKYLVEAIQTVYRGEGIDISDKHIEVILRQMFRKRKIKNSGDTEFLPGQLVDRAKFEDENQRIRSHKGSEAEAEFVLMGIMRAAESTESWLSAASFQRTTQVLTDAAIKGKGDHLRGLKENVIIGRVVPAGTGLVVKAEPELIEEESAFGLPELAHHIGEPD